MNRKLRQSATLLAGVLCKQGFAVIDAIEVDRQTPYPFVRIAYDKFNNDDCKNKLVLIGYIQEFNHYIHHLPFATLGIYEYAASYEIATIFAEDITKKFFTKKSRREHAMFLDLCRENCTKEMKAFALFLQDLFTSEKEEPPDE